MKLTQAQADEMFSSFVEVGLQIAEICLRHYAELLKTFAVVSIEGSQLVYSKRMRFKVNWLVWDLLFGFWVSVCLELRGQITGGDFGGVSYVGCRGESRYVEE